VELELKMAPALTETPVDQQSVFTYDKPSKAIFPDGIKTSGQTNPTYELLKPYSEFPKEITGSTVWRKVDYEGHPEQWVHQFSEEEIREMSEAADAFLASGTPLTGITKVGYRQKSRPEEYVD
jgi:TPP-dependent 2-oxoacid decarboxylase